MRKRMLAGLGALVLLVVGGIVFQGDVAATSLSSRINLLVSSTLTGTAGLTTPSATGTTSIDFTLANGTGANQADKVYAHTYTILTGATEDIDLKAALTDDFGAAFTPAKVVGVMIYSRTTNTTDLTLFGDANSVPILSTAATTMTLTPGDVFLVSRRAVAGITVTAATGDIIQIVNGAGASAVVDVIIIARSA